MTEIRIADDVYNALLDAIAEAALKPCPTGALVNRDALMLALVEVANIVPASLGPYDAEALAEDLGITAVNLNTYLAARGLPRPDVERDARYDQDAVFTAKTPKTEDLTDAELAAFTAELDGAGIAA